MTQSVSLDKWTISNMIDQPLIDLISSEESSNHEVKESTCDDNQNKLPKKVFHFTNSDFQKKEKIDKEKFY